LPDARRVKARDSAAITVAKEFHPYITPNACDVDNSCDIF